MSTESRGQSASKRGLLKSLRWRSRGTMWICLLLFRLVMRENNCSVAMWCRRSDSTARVTRNCILRIVTSIGLALALVCSSAPAAAQVATADIDNGNGFYAACRSGEVERIVCVTYLKGFVAGQYAAWGYAGSVGASPKWWPTFCFPKTVNYGQMVDVVIKKLEEHPEIRHLPTGLLIQNIFNGTFKCDPPA